MVNLPQRAPASHKDRGKERRGFLGSTPGYSPATQEDTWRETHPPPTAGRRDERPAFRPAARHEAARMHPGRWASCQEAGLLRSAPSGRSSAWTRTRTCGRGGGSWEAPPLPVQGLYLGIGGGQEGIGSLSREKHLSPTAALPGAPPCTTRLPGSYPPPAPLESCVAPRLLAAPGTRGQPAYTIVYANAIFSYPGRFCPQPKRALRLWVPCILCSCVG